ncbi:MAG: NAD-dependent epimerase/dehydratase family protein, partial [Chloroflexota bacterium]
MRILITGGTGLVGTQLGKYLGEAGHQIISVGHKQRDEVISADLRDETTVFRLVNEHSPDLI